MSSELQKKNLFPAHSYNQWAGTVFGHDICASVCESSRGSICYK